MFGLGRTQAGILRVGADFAGVTGAALEVQFGTPLVVAGRRDGEGGEIVFPVGQGKAVAEAAVGAQPNLAATDGHCGIGLGRSVDDQLGVDVEPEAGLAAGCLAGGGSQTAQRAEGAARGAEAEGTLTGGELGGGLIGEFPHQGPAHELGDFHRTDPHAAHLVHGDDFGQGFGLRRCPARGGGGAGEFHRWGG